MREDPYLEAAISEDEMNQDRSKGHPIVAKPRPLTIVTADYQVREAPHTPITVAVMCQIGNHANCRGIVLSLLGDRECECSVSHVHNYPHQYEGDPQ